MTNAIQIQHLGRMRYEPAFDRQRETHAAVVAGDRPETILIVEHEPVVTVSKRKGAANNITADEAMLARAGVEVCRTDRGGDVTYHGPGQIVAYPIIRLNDRGLNLRQYVWLLEQAMIDTVAAFGIEAGCDDCAVGVWVDPAKHGMPRSAAADRYQCTPTARPQAAKLAAIGVRASRWVTMHGLALNVATNLDHFNLIVPCGLVGRPVTSMRQLLGDDCPPVDAVGAVLIDQLTDHLANPQRAGQPSAR